MSTSDQLAGARGWTGSAEDYSEVLKVAADAITIQSLDHRIVYANDAAARQMGFVSAEEFLATPLAEVLQRYEMVDESGQPFPVEALPGRRALAGEPEPSAIVGFRVRGEREERWAVVRSTPVTRHGRVAFVINAFQDVTGLKRTEQRLRLLADAGSTLAASTDYPSTLQALADIVVPQLADWCVVDVVEESRPGEPRRIVVAHPDPGQRSLAEELQRDFPPDPDRPSPVAGVIDSGEPMLVGEVTDELLERVARSERHLELLRRLGLRSVAILPLVARDQVLGALTLAGAESGHRYERRDLPFLEDLARRAAVAVDNARLLHEANAAIRLRDDFLAMASHDMRTPLAAILANVELARRRLGKGDPGRVEAVDRNLVTAERTTGKLARLVAELMDVSMLRSGHALPLEMSDFDLVAMARDLLAEHERVTARHGLRLEGERSLAVRSDRLRIERVLDNLIANALKYTPAGGDIVVRVTRADDAATVAVRDQGIGIPAAEIDQVFEPYRRGSNARGLGGMGLGLAGAREVLAQLGGKIEVESVEGAGSTFTLQLPID